MLSIAAPLMICVLGQVAVEGAQEPKIRAIAPFVDAETIAVMEFDLAGTDLRAVGCTGSPAMARPARWPMARRP